MGACGFPVGLQDRVGPGGLSVPYPSTAVTQWVTSSGFADEETGLAQGPTAVSLLNPSFS